MDTKSHEEIHTLTVEEIGRQKNSLVARHQEIVGERAEMYRASAKGSAAPTVDADEYAAREHAKRLLNGSAPESLNLPPEISRDRILLREQRGIEIALKILDSKDLVARAAAAVVWSENNAALWRALCRDIVLTMVRLDALEQSAHELLSQCPDISAVRLPFGNIVGGRQVSELWSVDELTERALAEGVVTSSEIRKVKNGK